MATRSEMMGSTVNQFPQPTRPTHATYETNFDSLSRENRIQDQYFTGYNPVEGYWAQESERGEGIEYNSSDDDHDREEVVRILRVFGEELDEASHEILKKFSKVKKDVPVKKIFRETLHEFRTRPVSEVFENFRTKLNSGAEENDPIITQRGVNDLSATEGNRLERFKVKTVNIPGVGVVKEGEDES